MNDEEDKQVDGFDDFVKTWPASDVKDWPGSDPAELGKDAGEGGVWTGSKTISFGGIMIRNLLTCDSRVGKR